MRNVLNFILYLILTFISFSISNYLVFDHFWMDGRAYPSMLIVSFVSCLATYFITNQNLINATTQVPQLLLKSLEYIIIFSLFVLIYWFVVNSDHYSKEHITLFILSCFIFIFIFNYYYIRYLRNSKIGIPLVNSMVIGQNNFTQQFVNSLEINNWMGFRLKHELTPSQFSILNLKDFLIQNDIQRVFISWDEFSLSREKEIEFRNLTEENVVQFYAISEIFSSHLLPSSYNLAGNFPYVRLFSFPLDTPFYATSKRLFDIFFSLLFFVAIASWLFPIIILALLISQGSPIFFSQKRHGLDNKEFECYKFRTMVDNKRSNSAITVRNDPRVTKLGKILRKTSLDELPQFWNVLIGDMSVVGPRPHMLNQNDYYNELIEKYNFRHYVKPGITGLAQVNGFRGEIREEKNMKDRIQSDIYYIKNWSFRQDLFIIYRTIANMIRGDENAI